jgi:hypothetical protein
MIFLNSAYELMGVAVVGDGRVVGSWAGWTGGRNGRLDHYERPG